MGSKLATEEGTLGFYMARERPNGLACNQGVSIKTLGHSSMNDYARRKHWGLSGVNPRLKICYGKERDLIVSAAEYPTSPWLNGSLSR